MVTTSDRDNDSDINIVVFLKFILYLYLSLSFHFFFIFFSLFFFFFSFPSPYATFQLTSSQFLAQKLIFPYFSFLWFFQFYYSSPFLSLPLLLSPFSPPRSNLLIFLNLKSQFSFSFYLNILFLTWIPSSLASTIHLYASILGCDLNPQYSCTLWPKLFLLVFLHLFCNGFKGL